MQGGLGCCSSRVSANYDAGLKKFQPRDSFQCFLNRRASQALSTLSLKGVIQFANVICDFRSFAEKAFKRMTRRSRRRYHVVVIIMMIKDDAFKDMFPAIRKKCSTDKRTRFQCQMTFVVFGEKVKDIFFNFEGKCDSRHVN